MAVPTRVNWATTTASGTGACTVDITAVPVGAWVIAVMTTDTTGISAIPTAPASNWRNFLGSNFQQAIGSRRVGIVGRIKASGENTVTWSTTGSSFKRMTVFWGEGTRIPADWTFGMIGVRNAADVVSGQSQQAGTSTTSVAPSVTVAEDDSTVLSLFVEATTSTGAASITAGGATLWFNAGDIATYIEQHSVAYLDDPTPGATTAVTATYSQVQASNGLGVQIILPPASVPLTRTASGGIALGGTADWETGSSTLTRTATGGITLGGGAPTSGGTLTRTAAGGVALGGTVSRGKAGFASVAQFLSTPGATSAWRLGGGPYPQHSMYAGDRSVELGYGALEFSCGWTSDLVPFGLGPQYLDTIAGVSGSVDPTTMTWATLSSTYQIQNNPVSPGVYQPFYKLEDAMARYAATHVMLIDPKFGFDTISKIDVMLDLCDAYGGPTRFIIKFDSPTGSTNLTTRAHARGYHCINYWGTDTTTMAAQQGNWDSLGLSYLASGANWTAAKTHGKPVWAAVVPDQSAYNTAWTNSGGFNFANVSGVTSVTPVSAPYTTVGPAITIGGSATHVMRYTRTASGGIGVGGSTVSSAIQFATAQGGVALSGSVAHEIRQILTASGGIALGGTASRTVQHALTATGGVVLAGAASTSGGSLTRTASGGITLGGIGNVVSDNQSRTASGGLTLGGSAASIAQITRTTTGGVTLSGSATFSTRYDMTASGGVAIGGSAVHVALEPQTRTALGGIVLVGSALHVIQHARVASGGIALGGSVVVGDVPEFPTHAVLTPLQSRRMLIPGAPSRRLESL